MKRGGEWGPETRQRLPPGVDLNDDAATVPVVRHPDDLLVVVAGGETGRWMSVIPGWAYASHPVTMAIGD